MNSEEDTKNKILEILKKAGETYTKDIAKKANLSPTTVSKYLKILKAEKKVETREQKPYVYWSISKKESA